ncbi:MAG TPA: FapA family protein [Exilispira sp.]|nr:FapA family protein [Exilispira sp.]
MGIKDAIYFFDKTLNVRKLISQILQDSKNQSLFQQLQNNFFFADEVIIQGEGIENYFQGEDIYYNEGLGGFCTKKTGFVEFGGIKINVYDCIITLKNNLYAYLILPPFNLKTSPNLSVSYIFEAIKEKGIINTTSEENIQKAFDYAKKGYGIVILIAKGKEPINGREEEVKLFFDLHEKAGKIKEDGTIDFKEKEKFLNVKAGDVIGEYIPAKKPEKGYDVFGQELPAIIEKSSGYKLGKNLKIDGTKVSAEINGIIEVDEFNKISISNVLKIEKDVDLSTGNIKSESSIHIIGKINPGFTVETSADLIVEDAVFNSNLRVGGNCNIRHGITGEAQKNNIFVKGNLICEYIENTVIKCENNIQFSSSILHSKITCGGIIKGTGKAIIIGGEIFASQGIYVNEVGSKLSVPTVLIVGVDIHRENKLAELKQQSIAIAYKLKQAKLAIGENYFKDPEGFLSKLPDNKLDEFERKIDLFFNLIDKQKEIEQTVNTLRKSITFKNAVVSIKSRIYDGVTIKFGDEIYINKKEMSGPITFYFDENEHKIKFK